MSKGDGKTTNTEREPASRLMLLYAYRMILHSVVENPSLTPEEIGERFDGLSFNTMSVLHELNISAEQWLRDVAAMTHFHRMTRWLAWRAEGQNERHETVERLREKRASGWDLTPRQLARLSARIDAVSDSIVEYARLHRRRRAFCARHPDLFCKLTEDGEAIPGEFEFE